MTFEELRTKDKENAFGMWETVVDAKKSGEIPVKFAEYFKDVCECGSENVIKKGLTQLTCCNPKCPIKQGYAIAEMFTRFGVKGLKEATCYKIYSAMKAENLNLIQKGKEPILVTESYTSILVVPFDKYPSSVSSTAKGIEFYKACCKIRSQSYTFAELVANLAIPGIGTDAEALLRGINSPTELLDKIDAAGSVRKFCIIRGFNSEMAAFNLRNALVDIVTAGNLLQPAVRREGAIKISVCMTGVIIFRGDKITKKDFLNECNKLCVDSKGTSLFEIKMNSAIETNGFILFSKPSNDRKYLAGQRRGDTTDIFGKHKVLMHVDLFYELLERVMNKWNKELATMTREKMQLILTQSMEEISMMALIS